MSSHHRPFRSKLDELLGKQADELREDIELLEGFNSFNSEHYLKGLQTPVFFGSAINSFGVYEMLDAFGSRPAPRQIHKLVSFSLRRGLQWSGFRFKQTWIQLIRPNHILEDLFRTFPAWDACQTSTIGKKFNYTMP